MIPKYKDMFRHPLVERTLKFQSVLNEYIDAWNHYVSLREQEHTYRRDPEALVEIHQSMEQAQASLEVAKLNLRESWKDLRSEWTRQNSGKLI